MNQILVNGLIDGVVLGVLALAFTVVYVPTRVFFVGLGAVYTLAPYVAWSLMAAGWPSVLSFCAAILTCAAVAMFVEIVGHRPLQRKRCPSGVHLVSSLGFYILVTGAVGLVWGTQGKVLRIGVAGTLSIGSAVVTYPQVFALLSGLTAVCVVLLWLKLTTTGLRFRALADNPREMELRGFNVDALRLSAFAIGGALAALASLTRAFDLGFDPNKGLYVLMLAIIAMIVGGRFTFVGPLLGALLISSLRVQVAWFTSARWQDAITFVLLALFLILRPQGLLSPRISSRT